MPINVDSEQSEQLFNSRLACVAVFRAREDVRIYTNAPALSGSSEAVKCQTRRQQTRLSERSRPRHQGSSLHSDEPAKVARPHELARDQADDGFNAGAPSSPT